MRMRSMKLSSAADMESDLSKRKAAFQVLLRDVGKQLGKHDTDEIEVLEGVPQDKREKGGIKLLEHLQRKGRFSLWKTQPLREILRNCHRYDLADDLVKNYQLQFVDTDSPLTCHRPPIQAMSGNSPLLSTHCQHSRSDSVPDVPDDRAEQSQPITQEGLQPCLLQDVPPASSQPPKHIDITPPKTRGNSVDAMSPSRDEGCMSDLSSPHSDTTNSTNSNELYSPNSISSPGHSSTTHAALYITPELQLADKVTEGAFAVVEHVLTFASHAVQTSTESLNHTVSTASFHSSLCNPGSKTSLHSLPQTPLTRHACHRHSSSVTDTTYDHQYSSRSRTASVGSSKAHTDFHQSLHKDDQVEEFTHLGKMDSLNGSQNIAQDDWMQGLPVQGSRPQAKPVEEPSNTDSLPSVTPPAQVALQRPRSAKEKIKSLRSRLAHGRPISAKKKQTDTGCIVWKVKRDDLVLSASKHKDLKRKPLVCQSQLEIDIGHGKNNPRMSLSLYPYRLFEDEKKNITLLATIDHKRVDLVRPDLCIQLSVSVMDDDGHEINQKSIKERLNMNTIHIRSLLSHTDLLTTLQKDHVELKASVQTAHI